MSNQDLKMAYIPLPDKEIAEKISAEIVKKNIVACCNIFPNIRAIYKWDGEIKKDSEVIVICKLSAKNLPILEAYIQKNHPYSIAALSSWDIGANIDFANWIKG